MTERTADRRVGVWIEIVSVLLFASSCATERFLFEPTPASLHRAILAGEINEALASFESRAVESEKNATASSFFPQPHWLAAAQFYTQAARAALGAGYLQKSITYGAKAQEMAEKAGDHVKYLNAIDVTIRGYRAVRNLEEESSQVAKGFAIVQELQPDNMIRTFWEGRLNFYLGTQLMRRRDYKQAIDALAKSLRLQKVYLYGQHAVAIHRAGFMIITLTRLGDAHRRAGSLSAALEQYQHALNSIQEWGLKYVGEDELYRSLGEIYLQENNFSLALENFKKALVLAEKQRRPEAIEAASVGAGNVLRRAGKPEEAVPYYEKAIRHTESIRSLLSSVDYRGSFFDDRRLGAYVNIIPTLVQLGRHDEAFNYSERARSRVFLDVVGSKMQLSRLRSGLLEEERALQERIAAIKARLSGEEEGEVDRAGLRKELQEAEKAYNAFLDKVRKQDKEQASLMTVEPLTLKEVQTLLDPGTTLIEYFVTGRDILVWVVEKNRTQFLRVELRREKLSGLVKTLRETIFALDDREKFNEVSKTLYGHLLEGVLPHVTGKELIIVPHDVLHYLPFHALLSPIGRYLIEKYPIYYLSSASLLQFVKEKRKAKSEMVLALGNPDLGDPGKDLKFAELEAREVQKLYPQSTVLLRREATEEKGKALSPQHDILHFATHAELKEDDPLSSAILLAKDGKEDGRLEVKEIFGMDLKANLVVLSACETGLGKLSSGDEFVGLTRAFIYAGTPSVVASLWKVEDSSTAALMASFYRNLKTMSKVEALRQAQLELIRGEGRSDLLAQRGVGGIGRLGEVPTTKPQSAGTASVPSSASVSTSHPYFWAPFILVGDGK